MKTSNYLVLGLMAFVMSACISSAGVVGTASIRAPAVIVYNNTGTLTTITLTITNGNGSVNFTNSSSVANSTLDSADLAAAYGAYYTGYNFSRYNFTYTVLDEGSNVSGPSAGAAMTLLAISAFKNRPLRNDITITGTISPDGDIGQIGGAIDKVSAASAAGLRFIMVPQAVPGSIEEGIYYIAQSEYNVPVVEVANISQAAAYEFGNMSDKGHGISINFSDNYMVGGLQQANLQCSNSCDEAPFLALTNYTLNRTISEVENLSSLPGFKASGSQLLNDTNQAEMVGQKGYLYTSADINFLDYLDAFYLSSYNVSRGGQIAYMQGVQTECSDLVAPQLTSSNYEYVISAQLRQGWANYTINSTLAGYNVSGSTEDDVVYSMYSAAQAQSWCSAAALLYSYPYSSNGSSMTFASSLAQTAVQRIDRAQAYPGMYLTLAIEAYKQGNYPVAIIDADYAYALSASTERYTDGVSQLLNQSAALVATSDYGAWATEFSKEAQFYTYESSGSKNSTLAQYYAQQAYTSAFLASQLSNDTKAISRSLVLGSRQQQPTPAPVVEGQGLNQTAIDYTLNRLTEQVHTLSIIVGFALALIVGCIMLIGIMAHKLMVATASQKKGRRRRAA